MRIVIVNPVWDRRDAEPDAVLERFSTLTGWAGAIRAQQPDAGSDGVRVVQQFDRDARVEHGGVTYHFVSRPCHQAAAALDADLFHVNGFDRPLLLRGLKRAAPATPIAVQDHGGFDPARLSTARRAWMRHGLASADVLMVATPPQADVFRASGVVPRRTAIRDVMESSTTLRVSDRAARRDQALSILCVGRLNANKDPLTVVDGFARFAATRSDARLTFVYSDATLEPQLRARIDGDARLRTQISLAGQVAHTALASYYADADLFVLGSQREGSGYAALEAMACGVAPVLTRIPSFRWITDEGRLGALWEPGSAPSLAEALDRLAERDLRVLGEACRDAFERQWSWEAIGQRAMAIYRDFSRS